MSLSKCRRTDQTAQLDFTFFAKRSHLIPIGCCGPIGRNLETPWFIRLWIDENSPILSFHLRAKMPHHGQSHVEIRQGTKLAKQLNFKALWKHRFCQQQRRGELAALAHVDADFASLKAFTMYLQGEEALFFNILDISTQSQQSIHQGLDGTLFHAFGAREEPVAFVTSQIGRHETCGGATVDNVDDRLSRLDFTQGFCQH